MLCLAETIKFMCEVFYFHRISEIGLGRRIDEEAIKSYIYICQKLINFSKYLIDSKKIDFIFSRCKYTVLKIINQINKWEEGRKEKFLREHGILITDLMVKLKDI